MLAAVALGSNLPSRFGSPAANLREALRRMAELGRILAVSSFRETEPVGLREQPHFVNAAALVETELLPLPCMRALLSIETAMGRVRPADQPPKGPRIVDLDLLLCVGRDNAGLRANSPELQLPHPALPVRRFVLEPLAEIVPGWVHPVSGETVAALLARLPG